MTNVHVEEPLMISFNLIQTCVGSAPPPPSPPGERGPGLRQHLGPVQHEHAEGARVPAVRRPGEPVGAVALHRLQPVRPRAGVQSPPSHPRRWEHSSEAPPPVTDKGGVASAGAT